MADKVCFICNHKIGKSNEIISREKQSNTLNYWFVKAEGMGFGYVRRVDMELQFKNENGETVSMCRQCFQFMIDDMVNKHYLGSNYLDQEKD